MFHFTVQSSNDDFRIHIGIEIGGNIYWTPLEASAFARYVPLVTFRYATEARAGEAKNKIVAYFEALDRLKKNVGIKVALSCI